MNLQKIKSNYAQISILIIGILITASWMFWIVPDLKNDFSAFEEIREQLGNDAYVEFIGGKLSTPDSTKDLIEYKIVNVDGDIFEIKSSYTAFDLESGEKVYENIQTYFVDHKTRKHVGNEDWYFIFPLNVQKQNYLLLDPTIEAPATFVFEETKYIDDLEVYVFSCETFGDDLSSGYAEFAPAKIYADQTCKTSIEPITGKTVEFANDWDIYSFQDGSRVPVEIGGTETTVFTEQILLQSAKETKNLFSIFDFVIPTFMLLILGATFSTSVIMRQSREKTDAIKKAQQKIEMEKKIEKEKDEFVAMIAHELKNPLTPIKFHIYSLKRPKFLGELNKKQADAVDGINSNALRLERLIDDLLDAQKLELGKIKFENKSIVVEEFMAMVTESLKTETEQKGCQLINHTNEEIIMKSDTSRLAQVFSNLINNSIDFIPENKGKIEINAQKKDDGNVLFSVKDNGSGMTLETQKNLFQKFYQADTSVKRKHGGTGLGLAICKGIVEGLGGKIWLESEVGKGTDVYFTIPRGTLDEDIDNR